MPTGVYDRKLRSPDERFIDNYIPVTESGCWIWIRSLDTHGYGQFYVNGKSMLAHRFSYILKYGSIQKDKELDHLCRVRSCVNPDHLDPVSHEENMHRGKMASRNSCKNGHLYTKESFYIRSGMNARVCRICDRLRKKRYNK